MKTKKLLFTLNENGRIALMAVGLLSAIFLLNFIIFFA